MTSSFENIVSRSPANPILKPMVRHPWESYAAFNWCPIRRGKTTSVVYRAMGARQRFGRSTFHSSTIGCAEILNGVVSGRRQLIVPKFPWEQYGCEDPRVTKLDGKYYIFYTALANYPPRAKDIRVAVAVTNDFHEISERHRVTPFNAKAMTLFPERIRGKMVVLFTLHSDRLPSSLALAECTNEEDLWSEVFWRRWYAHRSSYLLNPRRASDDHIEVGTPPLKIREGWLCFYAHIEKYGRQRYSPNRKFGIEAILLDHRNPQRIIARTTRSLISVVAPYERKGNVRDVVFPSGALRRGKTVELFYGAGDRTGCLATISLPKLLRALDI
ncbi:MAG: hypothetical protein Q7S16_01415 [bacterium]|nr:hypothetical protein [bacterium]